MKNNIKQEGRKSPRDESFIKLLNSPAIMALGISTLFLQADSNEQCDRLIFLQQKKARRN